MAREPSQKLVDYGIIAGIGLAAYFVWTAFFKKEAPKECPVGQHSVNPCDGQIGWPAFLCNLGRNITGAALDCKPDTEIPVVPVVPGETTAPCTQLNLCKALDAFSLGLVKCNPMPICNESVPNYAEAKRLADKLSAGSCFTDTELTYARLSEPTLFNMIKDRGCVARPPHEQCPVNSEWDYILSKCVSTEKMVTCPDGSQHYPGFCPVVIPKCAESECIPDTTMCDNGIPKVCIPLGTGCEDRGMWAVGGTACKPLSNIVDCSCGKIDLNNPPGTTCESACKGAPPSWTIPVDYATCMRACPTGRDIICWGTKEVCAASGAVIPMPDHPGTYTDAAYLVKKECQRMCEYG